MKQSVVLLLQVALLVSCTKSISEPVAVTTRLQACFDRNVSKVHFSSPTKLAWNAEDEISVFTGDVNECFLFEGKTGDVNGSFRKNDSSTPGTGFSRYYSVFPYAESTSSPAEGEIHFTLPAVQEYVMGSFDPAANVMVAVSESLSDETLRFRNVCGYLRLSIYSPTDAKVKSIEIQAVGDQPLSGPATISAAYGSVPVLTMDQGAKPSVTIDCGLEGITLGTTYDCPTTFLCVLPAGDLTGGIQVTVTDTEGGSCVQTTEKTVGIKANSIIGMNPFQYSSKEEEIAGTKILRGNNIIGRITDSETGEGISGVAVSDGFTVVATDEHGVYQMASSEHSRLVYYSVPSGYQINVDPSNNVPLFYSTEPVVPVMTNRNDFVLTKETVPTTDFTILAIGDPQCKKSDQITRYKNETISDIKSFIGSEMTSGRCVKPVAIVLGDIIYNTPELWDAMKSSMSNVQLSSGYELPFFQTIGNHDHNGGNNVYEGREGYNNLFGPTDYSFNIGNAHIVVMDNIMCTSRKDEGWSYNCGFYDEQVEWLKQDLALVPDKENKIMYFCCHAPFGSKNKATRIEAMESLYVSLSNNYDAVLSQMTAFYEARVLSGHTHNCRNYVNRDYICKSGRPLIEHNPGAACGNWWYTALNTDGVPIGYLINEIKGKEVVDWRYKVSVTPQSNQMRIYDGDQIITAGGQDYIWYRASNKCGSSSYDVPGRECFRHAFIATVFAGDSENWTVSMYKDGEKVGDFIKAATGLNDIFNAAFFYGDQGSTNKWYSYNDATEHYWYFPAPNDSPADYRGWEVRAVHTIPGSGTVHTYTANKLKVNFSGFLYGTTEDDPEQPSEGGGQEGQQTDTDTTGESLGEKDGKW